ncbi:MAG: SpoIIE family protein phosphatase [Deltaproteobacteria bacterium]|nr:SpoIIE family protein phosphatase [Deltaproteobacteria bacterium]
MLSVNESDVDKITEVFYKILKGKMPDPISLPEDYPDNEIKQAVGYINKFIAEYNSVTGVMFALSRGELDLKAPKGSMPILQSLKNLHASLKHLTWTTQQIAKGDFGQRVSFMGEFAEAFNNMTLQLKNASIERQKANEILKKQVDELAEARHAMLNIMEDLGEANRELETAHRQILDSIRYASRIQRAVLPSESIAQRVFPQYMVIWEPRDVVGGDIYWCRTWGEGHLLILGDCTGHGVPGAFMTLIANGALDQAMQKAEPDDPADLIGHMHRLMQTWLGQDTDSGDSDDGIEVGACFLQPDKGQIIFSGARFSLFYFDRDGEVVEVTGDKKGIGYRAVPHVATFTNKLIEVAPGRRFFLTTDGIIDQIGGAKRRGFGKKRFARLITKLADVPLPEQGKYFIEKLTKYQGEEKRRDDVSIIGFSFDRI